MSLAFEESLLRKHIEKDASLPSDPTLKFIEYVDCIRNIVKNKLYKEKCSSVRDYFNQIGISRAQIYRFVDSSLVLEKLAGLPHLPCRERTCRSLKSFTSDESELRELWTRVTGQVGGNHPSLNQIGDEWNAMVSNGLVSLPQRLTQKRARKITKKAIHYDSEDDSSEKSSSTDQHPQSPPSTSPFISYSPIRRKRACLDEKEEIDSPSQRNRIRLDDMDDDEMDEIDSPIQRKRTRLEDTDDDDEIDSPIKRKIPRLEDTDDDDEIDSPIQRNRTRLEDKDDDDEMEEIDVGMEVGVEENPFMSIVGIEMLLLASESIP